MFVYRYLFFHCRSSLNRVLSSLKSLVHTCPRDASTRDSTQRVGSFSSSFLPLFAQQAPKRSLIAVVSTSTAFYTRVRCPGPRESLLCQVACEQYCTLPHVIVLLMPVAIATV